MIDDAPQAQATENPAAVSPALPDATILHKADALMGRHRSFVPHTPTATPSIHEDNDIPLLTEIVAAPAVGAMPAVDARATVLVDVGSLQDELEQLMDTWLANTLPAVLAEVQTRLQADLDQHARSQLLPQLHALIAARLGKFPSL